MTRTLTLLMGTFLIFPGLALAQECLHADTANAGQLQRRAEAVSALRILNTAQLMHRHEEGSFATLPVLSESEVWRGVRGSEALSTLPDSDLLPGFSLHLATDGDKFAMSLTDTTDPCRFTVSTNDAGIIYTGYPINYSVVPEIATAGTR